jgi:hypothetical protein
MGFLKQHWADIQPGVKEMGELAGSVAQGFIRPWNSDGSNVHMILRAVSILKPQTIIETGTFEGQTTVEIAKVCGHYGDPENPVSIWTFDGGAPVSCYGDGKSVVENWQGDPQWFAWKAVEAVRKERFSIEYAGCEIIYTEGLTQDTLAPKLLNYIGNWDFCFQDSVHGFDLILGEWADLKPRANIGAVIVFDDIVETHQLKEWFPENNPGWESKWTDNGRSQLWAERIK